MVTVFPLDPSNSMNWSGGSDIPDTVPIIEPTPDYQSEGELRKYSGVSLIVPRRDEECWTVGSLQGCKDDTPLIHLRPTQRSNSAPTVIEVGDAVRRSSWKRSKETEKKEWIVRASNLLNEHYAQSRAGYIVLKR
ncbi:hypothetical protein GCK72_026098 [Caenorhabditis remanei]|uniref:Uncharacterized protein n=1 Tax=Caenorhabditis remanei TaxID=31234 RepID=A0A6A5G3X7_CAERE|nr:hypothetical protein GCK72_026098 [Caenorhabditis remanei]KAF1749630.1 hypothetical protein GCK72_026098 [Caenorhabditis remanei]